ncbi:restriction endonuclease subunit S [Duffyella gerundensis]|uniref:restriction endonuclease subunit S n=1 Tax=Duffyella gerundensis TaxID=1619313 RepID=UPI0021F6BF2D|nr:restriction endonuclease subunit S [Duffyella gerundensis]
MSKRIKELVPELRFSGFSEPWEVKALGPYLKQHSKKVPSSTELDVFSSTREGLKSQNEYFDGSKLANEGEYGVVPEGYFVYRHMSDDNTFKFNINKLGKNIAVSKEYPVFKTENLNPGFLLNVLNEGSAFKVFAASQKKGGTRTRLYFKTLGTFVLPLPSLEEQKKIADCLASIDELIMLHTRKLYALKDHKKGLIQRLFLSEGEAVPKLRFPEFKEHGKWCKVTLSSLGTLVSGLTYSPADVCEEGLLVLRSSNVQNGQISLEDNVYVRPDIKGANYSKPGDILICVRNGSKALIGKNALIPEGLPKCTHGAFMTVFRSNRSKFIYQLFQTYAYERQVAADLGATINSINGNQLKKYEFYVPDSDKEQHAIADFLSSIDDMILAQSVHVGQLKIHRQGLIQRLFPIMDEVNL